MDLINISQITSDTESVKAYLRQEKLLHSTYTCCSKQCYEVKYNGSKDGSIWRCGVCRKTYSIRKDSFFSSSRLPLTILLFILYLFCVGSSIGQTLKHLKSKITKKSLIDWFSFLRDICKYINDEMSKFKGIIEVDETYFHGLKKNDRGSGGIKAKAKRPVVFGLFERFTKLIKLFYVPSTKSKTLLPIITNNVEKGATVNSDGAKMYNKLTSLGYTHNVVYHNLNFVAQDGTHTNNIENVWSMLKIDNRNRHGAIKSMKEQHLQQFIWEWNNKQKGLDNYTSMLNGIRKKYPLY